MITQSDTDLDRSVSRQTATTADNLRVARTAEALEANGIAVLRAADAASARRIVLDLIPDGSQVYHGASETLDVTGITDEIEKSGRYDPVRPQIWSMDRQTRATLPAWVRSSDSASARPPRRARQDLGRLRFARPRADPSVR